MIREDKPKSTFLFLIILPRSFCRRKISIRHSRNSKNLEIGQELAKLLPWDIGALVIIGALVMLLALLVMPNNSVIECPRSNLLTGLESLGIAQKDSVR